jgi:hypothetical protein
MANNPDQNTEAVVTPLVRSVLDRLAPPEEIWEELGISKEEYR